MRDADLIARAKWMRQNPTPAEAALWRQLRAKRFESVKFRHQNVIGRYIADYACRHPMLIVEVDGDTHGYQESYDARRTATLEGRGYKVIRFSNADVLTNIEGVLGKIGETLKALRLSGERETRARHASEERSEANHQVRTPPLPNPLPFRGEGDNVPRRLGGRRRFKPSRSSNDDVLSYFPCFRHKLVDDRMHSS